MQLNVLEDPELTEAWLRSFAALSRTKGLKDSAKEKEVTDLFLSRLSVEVFRKVSIMVHPKELETMTFEDIRQVILNKIRPKKKLIIAERTTFLSLRQEKNESVQNYVHRLRDRARFCNFNDLNHDKAVQTAEDELIQMRLIDGLSSTEHGIKVLEHMQGSSKQFTLDETVQYIQQLEAIRDFGKQSSNMFEKSTLSSLDIPVSHVSQQKYMHEKKTSVVCKYCGTHHPPRNCPAYGKTCNNCGGRNHFSKVCKKQKSKSSHHVDNLHETYNDLEEQSVHQVFSLNAGKSSMKCIKMNNRILQMQIDTGSDVTIIPKNFWEELNKPKLSKVRITLKQFDGTKIDTLGRFTAVLEVDGHLKPVDVIVTKCTKSHGLIGTDMLCIDPSAIPIHSTNVIEEGKIGCLKGFRARLILKENARPSYFEARELPIHLKAKVIAKLNSMIDQRILKRIPPGGSKWASPIVVVRKPDGDVRICSDYKVGVNDKLCSDSYPLPRIETAFAALAGMKHFAKLDLAAAYNQIELEEDSKEITTINTPIGLLQWTRLPFGVKTASAQFQRAIESVVGLDIPNVIIYQDDIAVGGKDEAELEHRVRLLIEKLRNAGMKINEKKCVFKTQKLSFLGHIVSAEKMSPDPKLVSKILSIKPPTDRKTLSSFLGMINYYGRYIKNLSDLIEPLAALKEKGVDFKWTIRQQEAFQKIKEILSSEPVIRPFDVTKQIELTTDASENAIGAILSQEGHPVMFMSRRLSKAERNYSNIEREALAIVWATFRARHFLIGTKFLLRCDHSPLEYIFNPRRELPKVTSARILRWAIQLMGFDYEIQYVKGNTIPHVDAMSRLDFEEDANDDSYSDCCSTSSFVHWTETDVVNLKDLAFATKKDPILERITNRIITNKWSGCSIAERPYKVFRHRLTVEQGVIFSGDLIVPPKSMQQEIIKAVHDDVHCGMEATKQRLRLEAWWPGYSSDVERYVGSCEKCIKIKPFRPTTRHHWPEEEEAWSRVHMDHAYLPGTGLLFILVDAYSGWPEVIRVPNREAKTVLQVLRVIFARNGVPKTLVSDNAAEFTDKRLLQWLEKIGCRPMKTPPYSPTSNGIAERMVQTVKMGLKAYSADKGVDFDSYLARLLLSYRTIPHAGRKNSPSAMMGRQLRSPLTMSFEINESLWYKPKRAAEGEKVRFIVQSGNNTAVVYKDNQATLVHEDQLKRFNRTSEDQISNTCTRTIRPPERYGFGE